MPTNVCPTGLLSDTTKNAKSTINIVLVVTGVMVSGLVVIAIIVILVAPIHVDTSKPGISNNNKCKYHFVLFMEHWLYKIKSYKFYVHVYVCKVEWWVYRHIYPLREKDCKRWYRSKCILITTFYIVICKEQSYFNVAFFYKRLHEDWLTSLE